MEGAVCPSSELIILPLEYQYKNCSTKIAAIKNIGAGGVTSAHCQDCRGRNQIFFTKRVIPFFTEIVICLVLDTR